MFQIIFVDKDTVKGNPAALDDKTRFEHPKGPQGRPIHRQADLREVLRQMRKERGAGVPRRNLVIFDQPMGFFEWPAKAFFRLDDGDPTSHAGSTGLSENQEPLQ